MTSSTIAAQHVATVLQDACRSLSDATSAEGEALCQELSSSTGLSAPMVAWALTTQVQPLSSSGAWRELLSSVPEGDDLQAPDQVALLLAGNVFSALVHAAPHPLLLGARLTIACPEKVWPFASRFVAHCRHLSTRVGSMLKLHVCDWREVSSFQQVMGGAQVAIAYGSDIHMQRVRAELPPEIPLIEHGHGIGLIFVQSKGLDVEATARAAAVDICAFDQQGCLSPQVVVTDGNHSSAKTLAHALHTALEEMEQQIPRGRLSPSAAARQLQWRQTARAVGQVFQSETHTVSVETGDWRPSPGYRNVAVHCDTPMHEFAQLASSLGLHLKAIGFAGPIQDRRQLSSALRFPATPKVSPIGSMQEVTLISPWDGQSRWTGLVRQTCLR